METSKPSIHLSDAIGIPFLQMIGAIILSGILLPAADPLLRYSLPKAVLAVAVLRKNSIRWEKLIHFDHSSFKALLPMLIGFFGVMVITQNVLSSVLLYWPVPKFLSGQDVVDALGSRGLMILGLVIAPIFEEMAFRGGFLEVLLKRYSARQAILTSSLLFAVYHLNPWQFCGTLLFGIASGWLYLRTRSVILCILGHSFVNALAMLAPNLLTVWFTIFGVATLLIGFVLFENLVPPTVYAED